MPNRMIIFFLCAVSLLFFSSVRIAFAGSFLDRAGMDLWYEWYDEKGARNGYSHDSYSQTEQEGKPALSTFSELQLKRPDGQTNVSLKLVSTELEPMISYAVKAVDKLTTGDLTAVITGKPDGLYYNFDVDKNGDKKSLKVGKADFDYFDFEDHYIYQGVVVNNSRTRRVLNSFSIGVENREIFRMPDETIKVGEKSYQCTKFRNKYKSFEATCWIEKESETIVKQSFSNGAMIIISTKKKATEF